MNLNRVIWEGWTPQDFIDDLQPIFDMIMSNNSHQKPFDSNEELKKWCREHQPFYKKHVPEVYNHFKNQMSLIKKSKSI